MPKIVWSQLPQRIELPTRAGEVIDAPSAQELDAAMNDYEARRGFALPLSYREFVHWFGPGLFTGSWFDIAAPIPPTFRARVSDMCDIDRQHEMIHDPEGYWAESCAPEVLERLVLFASTEGGDWFFWDTRDVRNARQHEYGIYGHSRGNSEARVELVAPSFKSFITQVCLGPTFPFGSTEAREFEWVHYTAWPRSAKKADTRRKSE